ncbi:MAG: CinA family protein [Candidatus Protistobacter heckmanni]|nr:CinA family protein [Candidatus Protistobacter heckmanni]
MLERAAQETGKDLLEKKARLATAESCTGGMIGAALTAIAGSSDWFERGYITYSNQAKHQDIGVPTTLIKRHGAVSEEVARAMAEGARKESGADFAVSVTGIAGPTGSSPAKPVGTVCFGWAGPQGTRAQTMLFQGDRQAVRLQSAAHALAGLKRMRRACARTALSASG